MYRTADNLEDLDIELELNSFDSIMCVYDRNSLAVDKKYRDVDFYIIMQNDLEEEEIINVLTSGMWTAYLEYEGGTDQQAIKRIPS